MDGNGVAGICRGIAGCQKPSPEEGADHGKRHREEKEEDKAAPPFSDSGKGSEDEQGYGVNEIKHNLNAFYVPAR